MTVRINWLTTYCLLMDRSLHNVVWSYVMIGWNRKTSCLHRDPEMEKTERLGICLMRRSAIESIKNGGHRLHVSSKTNTCFMIFTFVTKTIELIRKLLDEF